MQQKLKRRKRFPLIVEIEPLFACNLACPGCGKIQHPTDILRKRLSVEDVVGADGGVRRADGARSPAASRCCTRRSTRSWRPS